MLSRTAANLYWLGRYVERSDATARLLEMGARMTMLPGAPQRSDWGSVMNACGISSDEVPARSTVIAALLIDGQNGHSVRSCIRQARANGRAERAALTSEIWESLNEGWRTLDDVSVTEGSANLFEHLEWTRQRAARFRGAVENTMHRDDRYHFIRLGLHLERASMTLRLLEVKYHALLPERDVVGGARDIYQWSSLLIASSSMRAYHHVYRGDISPWNVADLLVLHPDFPRSVHFCARELRASLDDLAEDYNQRHDCHEEAEDLTRRLRNATMEDVFRDGLHDFVLDNGQRLRSLHNAIVQGFGF